MDDVILVPVGEVRLVMRFESAGRMKERGIDRQGNTFERWLPDGPWEPWRINDEIMIPFPSVK